MTVVMVLVSWVLISFAVTFVWVLYRRLVDTRRAGTVDPVVLGRKHDDWVHN